MRKIEQQMNSAVESNQSWSKDNTTVSYDSTADLSTVKLHGNTIALVNENSLTLFDGGYQSNTTKSRLNALLTKFGIDGERVFQKDYQWYVRCYNTEFDTFHDIQFFNGMILR